jgi:hypothetical protein
MPWRYRRSTTTEEPEEEILYDDGGSGLYDACTTRFAEFGWTVKCDSRHEVWVKSADASYAISLTPLMLASHPIDQMLDHVEAKLKSAEARLGS